MTKHEGLGNDFLVALTSIAHTPSDLPALARRLCDRRASIGADGLILGVVGDDSVRFILHNADGSRAETSGNGLRCFGQALLLRANKAELDQVVVTDVGDRRVLVRQSGDPMTVFAQVEMGLALPGPDTSRLVLPQGLEPHKVGSVNMGNPHVLLYVDDPMRWDMAVIGPAIEEQFMPTGTNVHLITPTPTGGLLMNIWERGAGVTQACGSGACAAAVIARRWSLVPPRVEVTMPGGAASVEVGDNVKLTGPATYIATLDIPRG